MRKSISFFLTLFFVFILVYTLRAQEDFTTFDEDEPMPSIDSSHIPADDIPTVISLTLDEAIAIALRDNRDILLKTEDVKKAKSKIAESQAGLLPSLNFTGSWTDMLNFYPKDLKQTTTQTTLKQYLYKGGKTINTIEQSKYKLQASNAIMDKTKIETILNVKKTFYTLLLANDFVNLNKKIMDNTKQHLEFIKTRYRNGQASESDVLNIEASLGNVQQVYETSQAQLDSAQILLRDLLFLDEMIIIKPAAEFFYNPRDLAIEEALLTAMKNRPELRQYDAQEQVDKKSIEIAKADNRPSIYASWDYYSRSTTSLTFSPTKGWQDYSIVGVTFSWPIFDGWATKAKVEQAIADLKITQLNKETIIRDISSEIKNAYLDLKNAIAKIKTAESDILLYQDNLAVVQQKYDSGIVSSLDLDDANLKYNLTMFNKKQAIYDYIIAGASVEKARGGI